MQQYCKQAFGGQLDIWQSTSQNSMVYATVGAVHPPKAINVRSLVIRLIQMTSSILTVQSTQFFLHHFNFHS